MKDKFDRGSVIPVVSATTYSCTFECPANVNTGQSFVVSGTYTEDGVPVQGVSIAIIELSCDGSSCSNWDIGSATTDQKGAYTTTIGPLSAGEHVLYAADNTYQLDSKFASDQKTINVVNPVSTVTTVEVNPATITVGEAFVVGGYVKTPAGDAVTEGSVDLYLQRPGETSFNYWRATNDLTTSGFSTSADSDASLTAGTYKIKAVYTGTANFLASESSAPTTLTVTAPSPTKDSVLTEVNDLKTAVQGLQPVVFQNANNQKAFTNKLNAVTADINAGNYATAMSKLQNDLIPKTDGCALRGTADKTDWIKDCGAQGQIYPLLTSMLEDLQQL